MGSARGGGGSAGTHPMKDMNRNFEATDLDDIDPDIGQGLAQVAAAVVLLLLQARLRLALADSAPACFLANASVHACASGHTHAHTRRLCSVSDASLFAWSRYNGKTKSWTRASTLLRRE